MKILKRCLNCFGTGRMMGGGMIMKECQNCKGKGKIETVDDEIAYLQKQSEKKFLKDKRTKHYKAAKAKLKSLDESMTDEQIEKILDEELEKCPDSD